MRILVVDDHPMIVQDIVEELAEIVPNAQCEGTGDHRVTMYVDRGNSDIADNASQYQPRKNAALHGAGFYSTSETYGVLKQQESS